MWFFDPLVFHIIETWFSCLNGFTLVIFGALYSLLFSVSQGSVEGSTLTFNGLFSQIVTWMESCLIDIHTTSSHIFLQSLKIIMCKIRTDMKVIPYLFLTQNMQNVQVLDYRLAHKVRICIYHFP